MQAQRRETEIENMRESHTAPKKQTLRSRQPLGHPCSLWTLAVFLKSPVLCNQGLGARPSAQKMTGCHSGQRIGTSLGEGWGVGRASADRVNTHLGSDSRVFPGAHLSRPGDRGCS